MASDPRTSQVALPIETGDVAGAVAAPGWLLSGRRRDGIAMIVNHGTDHAAPGARTGDSALYARLGYSTATIPPLIGSATTAPLDNAVVLVDESGRTTHRSGFTTHYVEERSTGVLVAASGGRVRWVDTEDSSPDHGSGRTGRITPGPVITVASVVRDGVEVRLVRVIGREDAGK